MTPEREREREAGRGGEERGREGGRFSESAATQNSLWELRIEGKIRILPFDLICTFI